MIIVYVMGKSVIIGRIGLPGCADCLCWVGFSAVPCRSQPAPFPRMSWSAVQRTLLWCSSARKGQIVTARILWGADVGMRNVAGVNSKLIPIQSESDRIAIQLDIYSRGNMLLAVDAPQNAT